jgi:hypothetical protein
MEVAMGFGLRCEPESLELARSGAIWGNIWVESCGDSFPEARWNDLPVAFLVELIESIAALGSSIGVRRRVRFFDGPFWIDMEHGEQELISISVNRGGVAVEVGIEGLAHSVRGVAREILGVCRKRGWAELDDVRRLESLCP